MNWISLLLQGLLWLFQLYFWMTYNNAFSRKCRENEWLYTIFTLPNLVLSQFEEHIYLQFFRTKFGQFSVFQGTKSKSGGYFVNREKCYNFSRKSPLYLKSGTLNFQLFLDLFACFADQNLELCRPVASHP